MALRLNDRIILVTGAARGLGASYARYLARLGAHVIVNDLGVSLNGASASPIPAGEMAAAILAEGGSAEADSADAADPDSAAALVNRIVATHGRIDALVNNAGLFLPARAFAETSLNDFERVWRSHFVSTYALIHAALPHMHAQGQGRIINTISTQGLYGGNGTGAYTSAKAAVQGLTLSLAIELAGTGVTINAISPGAFTRMVDTGDRPAEFTEALKRNLAADLVAPAIAWLCHPDCTDNGTIVQAMSGWFSKTMIGDLGGFWDFAPTIDSVAAGLGALDPAGPIQTATSSADHAHSIVARADAARPTA